MHKIAAARQHFVVLDQGFQVYSKAALQVVATHPAVDVVAYFLHDAYLFTADKAGTLRAIRLPDGAPVQVADYSRTRVLSIYARDQILYVGTESGLVQTYLFNESTFRLQKSYEHTGPVMQIASDGMAVLVADHRDRVTEYPSGQQWDFQAPRLYSKRYLMVVEHKRIYVRTKGSMSVFYEGSSDIDDLLFSERGGFLFVVSGRKALCLDASTREARGEYTVGQTIVSGDALVSWADGVLEVTDLFMQDKEMGDVVCKDIKIKEKRVSEADYEKKYAFVQDGHSKTLPKISESRPKPHAARHESIKRPAAAPEKAQATPTKRSIAMSSLFSESSSEGETPVVSTGAFAPSIARLRPAVQPSSARTENALLMLYSTEGCMTSVSSVISNQITIRYHDNAKEPIEIKDERRCTIGTFCGRRYAISNGTTLDFNGEWTKELPCSLLGMTSSHVYVFSESLTVLGLGGDTVAEVYLPSYYTFCCCDGKIAIFSQEHATVIEPQGALFDASQSRTIPVRDVSFAAFYEDRLWVQIKQALYRLDGCVFVKQCALNAVPIALYAGFILTLAQPTTLLPKPAVEYTKIKQDEPVAKAAENVSSATGQFDILKMSN
ncbi:hypothetical protein PAPHI01_1443 [Pancytospora philotis]|nr:hypothetical protein PAPHI01_1443 [Pancytospora philotis]